MHPPWAMRTLIFMIGFGGLAVASAPQPAVKPVATTSELMLTIVDPSSNVVFEAAAEPPKTDEGWAAARAQALVLAESANLLLIGSRVRDTGEWTRAAVALRDAAELAAKTIESRNATDLEQVGDRLYETCEQCHSRYYQRR